MTATVTPLKPRTLAHVLLDIQRVGPLVWSPDTSWDCAEDEEAALNRLDDLQAEARTMIEQLTGCSWDSIQEAAL